MQLSLHFLIFLQILRDVKQSQAYKYIITKDYLSPRAEARMIHSAALCHINAVLALI